MSVATAVLCAGALAGCTPAFTPVGSAGTGPVPGEVAPPAAPPAPDTDWGTLVAPPVAVRVTTTPRASTAPRATASSSLAGPVMVAPTPRDPAKHRQCMAHLYPRHYGLTTTAGTRSITTAWYTDGDPEVRSFRVAALDQDASGPASSPVWQTVAQSRGCGVVGATLTGLASGHSYVVWLDAVTSDPEGGGTTETMVGTSGAVAVR